MSIKYMRDFYYQITQEDYFINMQKKAALNELLKASHLILGSKAGIDNMMDFYTSFSKP
jgi:hydroxylamine reductase (hybrid-cluster protein)